MKNLFTLLFISAFTHLSVAQCEDFEVDVFVLEDTICFGTADGEINIFGGCGEPLTVDIRNSEGENVNLVHPEFAWGLTAGWYYIYVENEDGCTFIDSVRINEYPQITVDLTTISASGFGECDAVVIVDTVYNYQGAYGDIFYQLCLGFGGFGMNEFTEVCPGSNCIKIDDNVCIETIDFETDQLAGIGGDNWNETKVFTNPQTGELNMLNPASQNLELTLFNLSGEIVFSSLVTDQSAVLKPVLESGVYLYAINHNGENIQTGKLRF